LDNTVFRPLTSLHLRSILTVGGLVFLVSYLQELNLRTDSDLSRYQSQTQNDNGRPIGHSFTPAVGPDETERLLATRTIAKDNMFFEQGKKLAFAHLDGLELDVLKGAIQTIRQSKPIFTMEVRVHKDVAYTDALMDFISDLGYDTYVINEVCGFHHMDYSNLLNVPRSISVELMHSDAFNILECVESINLIVGM